MSKRNYAAHALEAQRLGQCEFQFVRRLISCWEIEAEHAEAMKTGPTGVAVAEATEKIMRDLSNRRGVDLFQYGGDITTEIREEIAGHVRSVLPKEKG